MINSQLTGKKMKIAIQMDHIQNINIQGDTTFALCLEAQKRGYELYHYTPDRLSQRQNLVYAKVESLQVQDKLGDHYQLGPMQKRLLSDFDVVLLRQDPPFDMYYITTTHLLESVQDQTLVINDPFWVRNSPEKIFVTQFEDLMPETLITKDRDEVLAFREEFGDIIIKPLYGNGGAGVFYLKKDDTNLTSLLEMFENNYREPFIVQRYLKEVRAGDKRVILLNGDPVGVVNRVPSDNEARSNLHVGGQAQKTNLTARDKEICARLKPFMEERGFLLVGIDIIGDYLTEINVTSPTGLREIKKLGGEDIACLFWNHVAEKLAK